MEQNNLNSSEPKIYNESLNFTNSGKDDIAGTAFEIIANITHLEHYRGNTYTDKDGKHYTRTKFGFQPTITFNKGMLVKEHQKYIDELLREVKELVDENKKKDDIILNLQKKIGDEEDRIESLISREGRRVELYQQEFKRFASTIKNKDTLIQKLSRENKQGTSKENKNAKFDTEKFKMLQYISRLENTITKLMKK